MASNDAAHAAAEQDAVADLPDSAGRPQSSASRSPPMQRTWTNPNITSRLRSSTIKSIINSDVPSGWWDATAPTAAYAPQLNEIRRGALTTQEEAENQGKFDLPHSPPDSPGGYDEKRGTALEREQTQQMDGTDENDPSRTTTVSFQDPDQITAEGAGPKEGDDLTKIPTTTARPVGPEHPDSLHLTISGRYPNGYKFPPKHTWGQATKIGMRGLWTFTKKPVGFLVVLYALNVVAWGGMLFLLLIGAASNTMCNVQRPYDSGHYVHDCNDLYSPRRIWIEIDSQILNALFCVTGFGLIPWRFRDFYYLLRWRVLKDQTGLQRLAAWHKGWFRLPGSQNLSPTEKAPAGLEQALPIPAEKAADPPLTGVRAQPTKLWLMDFVVWAFVWNTIFQIILSVFMWADSRFNRPSWATGLWISFGMIVAAAAGIVQFREGKRIKATEGIPYDVSDRRDEKEQV